VDAQRPATSEVLPPAGSRPWRGGRRWRL